MLLQISTARSNYHRIAWREGYMKGINQHHTNLRRRAVRIWAVLLINLLLATTLRADRINQEGRILGPAPVVTQPILFNTAQADAIVSAMQIFPVTSAWNEDISRRPVLSNSAAMIAQIKADLSSSRQTLRPFYEMNYVLVP